MSSPFSLVYKAQLTNISHDYDDWNLINCFTHQFIFYVDLKNKDKYYHSITFNKYYWIQNKLSFDYLPNSPTRKDKYWQF